MRQSPASSESRAADTHAPQRSLAQRLWWVTLILLVGLAAALRWAASLGDFWLDEIWTWFIVVEQIESPADVFLKIRHENNHFLNTLTVYWMGTYHHWTLYRIPAVVAGTLTVVLAGLILRPAGRAAALLGVLITGGSYLLIHYSSEARGYATLILATLVTLWSLQHALQADGGVHPAPTLRRGLWLALGVAASILGLLSHPVFICVLGAAMLLVLAHGLRHRRRNIRWWLVPVALAAWLYWVNLRHLTIGGGEPTPALEVALQTLALPMGAPQAGPWAWPAAALFIGLFVLGCGRMVRDGRDVWVFHVALVLAPIALLVVMQRDPYLRYFLPSVATALLVVAYGLAWLWRWRRDARVVAVAIVAVVLIANAWHTQRLLRLGRGQYVASIRYMMEQTPGREVRISGDHVFRHLQILGFYEPWANADGTKELVYAGEEPGSEWVLVHRFEPAEPPRPDFVLGRWRYNLERTFPYAGLSGWHVDVYRRANRWFTR